MNSYTRLDLIKLCSPIISENHFRKKTIFEKRAWKSTFANRKWWQWEFSFSLEVSFRIFYCKPYFIIFSVIFYSNASYLQLYLTNWMSPILFVVTDINVNRSISFIKPSDQDLVECKPQNFLLHVVNPWRRSECQTGILFKLFCWKIYNLHFRFWAW